MAQDFSTTIGLSANVSSAGQAVDWDNSAVSSVVITNNSGISIQYTLDGSNWTTVANAAPASPSVPSPSLFRLRKSTSDSYPVPVQMSWTAYDVFPGSPVTVSSASNGIAFPNDLTVVGGGSTGVTLSAASATLTSTTAYAYKRTSVPFPNQSTVKLDVMISGPAGRVIGVRAARSNLGTNQTSQAVTLSETPQPVTLSLTMNGEDTIDFGIENRSGVVGAANCQVGDVIRVSAFSATEATTTGIPKLAMDSGKAVGVNDITTRPRTLVALGDSITFGSGLSTGLTYTTYGFLTTALEYLGGRLRLLYNAGIASNTTTQMLARLSTDVLAYSPGYCLIEGGVNDIDTGVSGATVASNIVSICETLLANNIVPLLMDVLPDQRTNGSASKTTEWANANRMIRDYAVRRPGIVYIPASQSYIDSSSVYPIPLANTTSDGTHPNALGAKMLGAFVGNAIAAVVSPAPRFLSNSDAYNLYGAINGGNATMYGTGGTASTSTSGQVATGWTSTVTGAGSTGVMLKIPRRSAYTAWAASTAYALGDIVIPPAASWSGSFGYICTVAGTSGGSAPTFLGFGVTTTDSTVTWTGIDLPVTWRASTQFKVGQLVQSTKSPSVVAVAKTVSGATAASEPTWPTTVGTTVTDGSVTWVMVPASALDGLAGDWQFADLDGLSTTGTTVPTINLATSAILLSNAGIAVGDRVFFEAEVAVDVVRGFNRFAAQLDIQNSGGSTLQTLIVEDLNTTTVPDLYLQTGKTLMLRSPEYTVPSNANKAVLTLKAQAMKFVGRFGQVLVRKV